jgi:two-component system sensor histidine kinase RegB
MNKIWLKNILSASYNFSDPLWTVNLRWFNISLLSLFCMYFRVFNSINQKQFILCFAIICLTALYNAFLYLQQEMKNSFISRFKFYEFVWDLSTFTLFFYICGGTKNPFYLVTSLPVFIAPFVIGGRNSILILLMFFLGQYFLLTSKTTFNFNLLANQQSMYLFSNAIYMTMVFLFLLWIISQLKYLNHQRLQLLEQNARVDRLKAIGALTTGFCHELSTPLNTIHMRAARILKQHPENNDAKVIEMATEQCSQSLQKLHQGFLTSDELQYELVNMVTFVQDQIEQFSPGKRYPIKLTYSHDYIPCYLSILNYTKLLIDLWENSFEAGATAIQIQIKWIPEQKKILLSLHDNGPGIPQEILSHFGEPFVTTKDRGNGLGLYHARLFIEMMGGNITLLNHNGARIYIEHPQKPEGIK